VLTASRPSKLTKRPGLEYDVQVIRKGTSGTHLCPGLQKAVLVGPEGINCDFPVVSASQVRSDAAEV